MEGQTHIWDVLISKYKTLSQMTEIICIHFVQFVRCRKICTMSVEHFELLASLSEGAVVYLEGKAIWRYFM